MIELWFGDEFIDFIYASVWPYFAEMGGYHFVWCEGYGP